MNRHIGHPFPLNYENIAHIIIPHWIGTSARQRVTVVSCKSRKYNPYNTTLNRYIGHTKGRSNFYVNLEKTTLNRYIGNTKGRLRYKHWTLFELVTGFFLNLGNLLEIHVISYAFLNYSTIFGELLIIRFRQTKHWSINK